MKKTKQHYVWRAYLKSWAEEGSVWCARKGKIFPTDLMNIGQERYFYKLRELTPRDIEFVRMVAIEPTKNEKLRELNEGWLALFTAIFKFKELAHSKGVNSPELDNQIDIAIHNMEEDYHQAIEAKALQSIESILAKDVGFFNTEKGRLDFSYFICVQYMRTKKRKEALLGQFNGSINPLYDGVNIESAWGVMRHIFATNMGFGIFANREKYKMVLVINESETPFIAGDQPVINTFASGSESSVVSDVEFYYPVSPKLAILISAKEKYSSLNEFQISEEEAHDFNLAISLASHEQIYANSSELINKYSVGSAG